MRKIFISSILLTVFSLFFIFLLWSCSPKVTQETVNLYKINCALCHGADGTLGVSGAKELGASTMTMDERIEIIKNGKGAMTGYSHTLTEKQIKQLATYTYKLKKV